jgi:hypothetical protein
MQANADPSEALAGHETKAADAIKKPSEKL